MSSDDSRILDEFATRLVDAWGEAVAGYLDRIAPFVERLEELAADPQVRASVAAQQFRDAVREYRPCHCLCGHAHGDQTGICTMSAVTSRQYQTPALGTVDVPLCAPCAAAQGVEVPEGARG